MARHGDISCEASNDEQLIAVSPMAWHGGSSFTLHRPSAGFFRSAK